MSKVTSVINEFTTFINRYPVINKIDNESDYKLALELIEGLLEYSTDTIDDLLNPLIEMLSSSIKSFEHQDEDLKCFIRESKWGGFIDLVFI